MRDSTTGHPRPCPPQGENAGAPDMPFGRARHRALATAMLAWAAVVLAVYFRHAWPLISGGEGPWRWPQVGQELRYTGLPYAHEALVRAARAIGAASVCAFAILGMGAAVARVLVPPAGTFAEWLALRIALGAGVLGCLLYALAGVGLYTPGMVRALVLVLAAAGCIGSLASARRVRRVTFPLPRARDWPWIVIVAGAVLYAGFCALAPEVEYDALWYHLELPRRWLAAGQPVDDVNEYVALYPLGWDLLFGAALTLDGPIAAKLLHWLALSASALVTGLLARSVLPRTSAWMAAAIFVAAPTVFWEATTAYIDLALALFLGGAVYALLQAQQSRDRRWLILAGLQLGFACATKHLGLVALVAILPCLAWSRVRSGSSRDAVTAFGIVFLLALLVPLPWYVRAWRASANPVFPDMYRVFGAEPAARWDRLTEGGLQKFKDHFGRPRTATHLLVLPWDMTMHGAQYGGTLGPLLLAGLPMMVLAATRRRPAAALLAGGVMYLAVWASPLSSFQLRFLVPPWVPLAALLACGTTLTIEGLRTRTARIAVLGAVAAVLLVSLPPWTVLHEPDRRGWDGWLTHAIHEPPTGVVLGGISQDEWLGTQVRTYAAWRWIDAHAPVGARVLTFFSGDQFYAGHPRIWSEAVNARAATWGATAGDQARVVEELRRLGVSYVLAPAERWRTAEYRRLDLLRRDIMGRALVPVYEDRWTVIYALRADAGAGTTDQS